MTNKKTRKSYTAEYKLEALQLAEKVGVKEAAKQLGVYESQIYNWRATKQKKSNVSRREAELAAEVAKLKRQLADKGEELEILKKAATYFAKNQK